jgi:hypothetical protein
MMRLNEEDRMAWEARRYAAGYPRWRCDGAGFYLYVSRNSSGESVGRLSGKWYARERVFERLDDALRYAEVTYYRRRADQIEARTPAALCY